MMPFNAFHQHTDDLHRIAVIGHQENHHCELDTYACQDELLQNHECKHQHHLVETRADCFFCQFHFSQLYEIPRPAFLKTIEAGKPTLFGFQTYFHLAHTVQIFNKGPPLLFI